VTLQLIDWPIGNGSGAGLGTQLTTAPGGVLVAVQVGAAAGLGPLLVQTIVPVTLLPAIGFAGKPLSTTAMSASAVGETLRVCVLLALFGSAVVVPALVVTLSAPLAGAGKVDVQVIASPTSSGFGTGLGVQLCVAPAGRPLSVQVGAAALLGPLLVQVPLTVTGWPATVLAGTVVAATMSACGTTVSVVLAGLFAGTGSGVVVPAVPVIVTVPLGGAVKLTLHVRLWPTASDAGVGVGVQVTVAPAGNAAVGTLQVGATAGSGQRLVQVTVPVTVLPAGGVAGNPAITAAMSACSDGSTMR
jgi:hypothetical protein